MLNAILLRANEFKNITTNNKLRHLEANFHWRGLNYTYESNQKKKYASLKKYTCQDLSQMISLIKIPTYCFQPRARCTLSKSLISLTCIRDFWVWAFFLRRHDIPSISHELPWWLSGKQSACQTGDAGSIPGLGRSRGEGNGNQLQ